MERNESYNMEKRGPWLGRRFAASGRWRRDLLAEARSGDVGDEPDGERVPVFTLSRAPDTFEHATRAFGRRGILRFKPAADVRHQESVFATSLEWQRMP